MNTLGKVLTAKLEIDGEDKKALFDEAFSLFSEAIREEAWRSRVSIYPFLGVLRLTERFLDLGFSLTDRQKATLLDHCAAASAKFPRDNEIVRSVTTTRMRLAS